MNTSQTIGEKSATNFLPPKKNHELSALKKRMFDIREELPGNALELFIERFPDYNNKKGISRLQNALSNFIVDEFIVKGFEAIAADYQKYLEDTEVELNKKSAA
jgi:hypothetical protein